jgi:Predicted ATP-dependent endonuclease of the OLD family
LRLDKVKLYNFRSFSKEQIIDFDDITTIIGNNSSGKTAALAALNIMFSQLSNDRILKRSDFHVPKDIKPENMEKQELYIEAVFLLMKLNLKTVKNRQQSHYTITI